MLALPPSVYPAFTLRRLAVTGVCKETGVQFLANSTPVSSYCAERSLSVYGRMALAQSVSPAPDGCATHTGGHAALCQHTQGLMFHSQWSLMGLH